MAFPKPPLNKPVLVFVFLFIGPWVLLTQGRAAFRVEWREAKRMWNGEWT